MQERRSEAHREREGGFIQANKAQEALLRHQTGLGYSQISAILVCDFEQFVLPVL